MDKNKALAASIMWALSQDVITAYTYCQTFGLITDKTTDDEIDEKLKAGVNVLEKLVNMNIINKEGYVYTTFIDHVDKIPATVFKFLEDNGFPKEEIQKVVCIPEDRKPEVSTVVDDTSVWNDIFKVNPLTDVPLVVRIRHKTKMKREMVHCKAYLEASTIATYDGNEWKILPPYHKYDFSPLTDKDKIRENALVTHWRIPSKEELAIWAKQCDAINTYEELEVKVDPYNEINVYDGLVVASAVLYEKIESAKDIDETVVAKIENAYNVLIDLQAAIDKGGIHNALEEE